MHSNCRHDTASQRQFEFTMATSLKDCQTLPNKGHKTAIALVRAVSLEKQAIIAIVSMSQVNCQLTMLNPGMLVDSRCIGYTPAYLICVCFHVARCFLNFDVHCSIFPRCTVFRSYSCLFLLLEVLALPQNRIA